MNRKSSSFFRVDDQVFLTLGAVCLLAVLVLAFRAGTHTPCSPVKITVNSTELREGNLVRFSATTQAGSSFAWDFGDGTLKEEQENFTNHKYNKAGRYTVSVIVNGECSDIQTIVIDEGKVVVNTGLQPLIRSSVTDTAYTNEQITFTDASTLATSWEWRFGETSSVDATSKEAVYSFRFSGRKTIYLKINNRPDLVTSYTLFVLDREEEKNKLEKQKADNRPRVVVPQVILPQKPNTEPLRPQDQPKKEEARVKAPAVTNDQLEALIRGVCDGNKSVADFYPYMGGRRSLQVIYNTDVMTIDQLCAQLKEIKSKKIKSLKINTFINESDNSLSSMTVTLKKKSWPF